MHAVFVETYGGPEVLKVRQAPDPTPNAGEVVIQAIASSINAADIKAREGSYHLAPTPPFVPGLDTYGTVVATGENVANVSVGDHVIAFTQTGSYAEYVVARDVHTFKVASHVDPNEAAAIPIAAFTAYNVLADVTRLALGETVLVQGASGGVGVFCTQIAKQLGAKTVIGTTTTKAKIPILRSLGCDVVIDTSEYNFVDVVNDITHGQGVNVVVDSFGSDVLVRSLHVASRHGRVVSIGVSQGNPSGIDVGKLYAECKSLMGYSFGTVRKHNPECIPATADQVLKWLSAKQFIVPVDGVFPLHDAAKAHAAFESHNHIGKIVLRMDI